MKSDFIFDWDTNFVYLSDKLKEFFPDFFERLTKKFEELDIPYGILEGTKDIWCRDYMPIQLTDDVFVGYNYNPDYLNEDPAYDKIKRLSHYQGKDLRTVQKEAWTANKFPYILSDSDIVLDGGNIVLCDKYVILTDKIYQENQAFTPEEKESVNDKITNVFGGLKPVIIPWKPVAEDVFGHSDGIVKFQKRVHQENWPYKPFTLIAPLTKKDFENQFLALAHDFYLDILSIPEELRGTGFYKYGWAYINYLQVGNKILLPSLDLSSDEYVLDYVRSLNPDCTVDSIEMREIVECGGALHCITWNIKK